jgi:hypothetical protein
LSAFLTLYTGYDYVKKGMDKVFDWNLKTKMLFFFLLKLDSFLIDL